MGVQQIKRGAGIALMLFLGIFLFSYLGDFTGSAFRTTATGDVHGFRYDQREKTMVSIVSGKLGLDGIPELNRGETLYVQIYPGTYVQEGYKVVEKLSGRRVAGGFGHPGTAGGICNNRHLILDEDKVCTTSGPKCNCDVEIKISTISFSPNLYSFQVCDGGGYTINKCNDDKGVINTYFRITESDNNLREQTYFRGQTTPAGFY